MASPTAEKAYEEMIALGQTRRDNHTYKRLIVFCDGTGQQSDGTQNLPVSNVTRFCRLIAQSDRLDGGKEIAQVVFYQNGVGTGSLSALSSTYASATGWGLNENVCEAYLWLKSNFAPGDEIFLFGFSRGAYTARAIGGLIAHIGILGKEANFQQVYAQYVNRGKNYKAEGVDENRGWKSTHTVKVIGVWDTVGSLRKLVQVPGDRTYAFHDTAISSYVENAFHALALDEHRDTFYPTLWSLPVAKEGEHDADGIYVGGPGKCNLKQCWFPGVHSDVGGSYSDAKPRDFSDIALAWMVDQCRGLLAFEEPASFFDPAVDSKNRSLWAAQPTHNSMTGVFLAGGVRYRAPGEYIAVDETGAKIEGAQGPTNETIHPSVRMRFLKNQDFKVNWQPFALNGFRLVKTNTPGGWEWVKTVKVGATSKDVKIPEFRIADGSWDARLMTQEDKAMLEDVELSKKLKEVKVTPPPGTWLRSRSLIPQLQ